MSVITSQAGSIEQHAARKLLLGGAAVIHRLASAFVLVFLLCGASPAFALTRLAAFAWTPATGPVAGYAVYATTAGAVDELVATVAGPSATVAVESSDSITVRVAAYDSAGRLGPRSDASAPVRLCPGDFDGDEVWGPEDWEDTRSCFGQPASGFCAGGDFDLDGTVSLRDVNAVKIGSNACTAEACPGDFDGDGYIGINDVRAVQGCYGQPAEGDCVPGDMNGDGVITLNDVTNLTKSFGAEACSL